MHAITAMTAPRTAPTDPRWQSLRARDPKADGTFVYAVRSTGVYCRPSCAARPARPKNVTFFDTPAEAVRAGYRACLRCAPDGPSKAERDASVVASLCAFLDASEGAPTLDALAAHVGLSPFHTQRLFKRVMGVTPRAWRAAQLAAKAREALDRGAPVTEALYEAGYGSSGRFYETSTARLGMTPTRYRARGEGETVRFATRPCSLGVALVAATEKGVCAIALGEDGEALVADLRARFAKATVRAGDGDFEALVDAVIAHVEAPRADHGLALDLRGTAFQQRVWEALQRVPPGETTTYTEVAARIGAPEAVRAVAGACAANTLAVVVPCHRVVRRDGDLSGYRWGVERKRALLDREARTRPGERVGKS